jgi:predicted Zn-ribbon and HTH transcriptional regulator
LRQRPLYFCLEHTSQIFSYFPGFSHLHKPEQSDNEEDEVEEIEETEEEIREKEFLVDQDIMAKIAGFRNNGYTGKPITCTVCTKKGTTISLGSKCPQKTFGKNSISLYHTLINK